MNEHKKMTAERSIALQPVCSPAEH